MAVNRYDFPFSGVRARSDILHQDGHDLEVFRAGRLPFMDRLSTSIEDFQFTELDFDFFCQEDANHFGGLVEDGLIIRRRAGGLRMGGRHLYKGQGADNNKRYPQRPRRNESLNGKAPWI